MNRPVEPVTNSNTGTSGITLVQHKGEPCVDSRVLAKQLGNQHESVMKTIKAYPADFHSLGILRFEIGEIVGRGQPEQFALLNEDQCYLLLTYSRNTPKVRALKVSLIMAFRDARYGHACLTLAARQQEASQSGRRLAHWRYDKPGIFHHVASLREQLKLPIDTAGNHPLGNHMGAE